jgi:uncharacterized protein DUF6338
MDIWEINKALLFVTLILPGFISIKIYDLVIAGAARDFSKSIIEAISYSVLNFAALFWLIIFVFTPQFLEYHRFLQWLVIVIIFVAMPVFWPFLLIYISKFSLLRKHLLSPINQPWDKFFSQKDSHWVVVHLKNGKVIRGKYSLNSSASAYPKERQIYIEEVWTKGSNGGFGKKITRTKGMILFESEISYIEFFK